MEFELNPSDVLYLAGTCEACGNEFDTRFKSLQETDLHSVGTCGICTLSYCSDCKFWCDCCDKHTCKKCTQRCVRCGEFTCKNCVTNGACAFCANDEDARIAAIAANTKADYDSISQFSNAAWFCIAAALLGVVTGGVYLWIYGR